jgi:hypothetical protein
VIATSPVEEMVEPIPVPMLRTWRNLKEPEVPVSPELEIVNDCENPQKEIHPKIKESIKREMVIIYFFKMHFALPILKEFPPKEYN